MKQIAIFLLLVFTTTIACSQSEDYFIIKHPYQTIDFGYENEDLANHQDLKGVLKDIRNAIKKKDWEVLKPHLSNENDFVQEFKKEWNPEDKDADIWSRLNKAFRLPGCFDNDYEDSLHFSMPYVFSKYPEEKIVEKYDLQMGDQVNFTTIVGNNVNIRSEPNIKSKVIDQLTYIIVVELNSTKTKESLGNQYSYEWIKIYTPKGYVGYVYGLYAFHFLSDYTARFHKKDGKWVMYAFYNG